MFIDTCAVHKLVEELKLSHYDYLYFFLLKVKRVTHS